MFFKIGIILHFLTVTIVGNAKTQIKSDLNETDVKTSTSQREADIIRVSPPSIELIEHGKKLYKLRCRACHSIDKNRVGPMHRNIYGAQSGSVADYKYSAALKNLNVIWSDKTIIDWLENPTAMAPGTSMGIRVNSKQERKAITAYLKSLSNQR